MPVNFYRLVSPENSRVSKEWKNKASWVQSLGYPPLKPVTSLQTTARLIGRAKRRCGIYLLEFDDSTFYIGQSVDVRSRFGQHRRKHGNIVGFTFSRVARKNLNAEEQRRINAAEGLGMKLSNIVHVSKVSGETKLDLVISQEEQDLWLLNPEMENQLDQSPKKEFPEEFVQRTKGRYTRFLEHGQSDMALEILRTYLKNCVPMPRRTEHSLWSMSCMPSTNSYFAPRLAVINMSVMEVLVLWHPKGANNKLRGHVNVASNELFPKGGWIERLRFWLSFPLVFIKKGKYQDAGQHQMTLYALSANSLLKLIQDKRVQKASAQLNLQLMRKRGTIYSRFHCSELVG
ncbi:GIY-YIG nuclease family protein [Granulosicoccus antarcticus]|uniref:GIY-YIG domain-containing protein n=1 Tax=Granulosicoccus antarcticus IMCC3135 TaxID=1192854 RepID=A0A2Z2P503_9GAMM|nr:GIY-YIG nuclease family protein [Granulosicoccus antarcticus]ASJ75757.1 hypothetical protein IMCC3135_28525 [Granulosicoccus antarcticus IMCC3135]